MGMEGHSCTPATSAGPCVLSEATLPRQTLQQAWDKNRRPGLAPTPPDSCVVEDRVMASAGEILINEIIFWHSGRNLWPIVQGPANCSQIDSYSDPLCL